MKRKVAFLILMLVVTIIPIVLLILNIIVIFGLGSIKMIYLHEGIVWFESRNRGVGMYVALLVLGLACIPLFFASVLLLYKERKKSKKREAEKPMTYTI